MKKSTLLLAALVIAGAAFADEYVPGYYRKDGTYVQGHHRTTPDSNPYNNYSTQGNTNPYTGQQGHVNPYAQPAQPAYPALPTYPAYPRTPVCGIYDGIYACK